MTRRVCGIRSVMVGLAALVGSLLGATASAQAPASAPSPDAVPPWTSLAERLGARWTLIVHTENAGLLVSDADAAPLRGAIAGSEVLTDTRLAWSSLARRLELSPAEAFTRLVGRRATLALGADGLWIVRLRLDAATASRVAARLAPAPRASIAGRPIFSVEEGRYWLTLAPARDGAGDERIAHVAPAAAADWLEAALAPAAATADARGARDDRRRPAAYGQLASLRASLPSEDGARMEGWARRNGGEAITFAAVTAGREGPRRARVRFEVRVPAPDDPAPAAESEPRAAERVARAWTELGVEGAIAAWTGPVPPAGEAGAIDRSLLDAFRSAGVRAVGVRLVAGEQGEAPPRLLALALVGDVSTATRAGDLAIDAGISRWLDDRSRRAGTEARAGFDGSSPGAVRTRRIVAPDPWRGLLGERLVVSWCYAWPGRDSGAPPPRATGWWIVSIGGGDALGSATALDAKRAVLLGDLERSGSGLPEGASGQAWLRPASSSAFWRRAIALAPESLGPLAGALGAIDRLEWEWSYDAGGAGRTVRGSVVLTPPDPAGRDAGGAGADENR